jgi:PAS domain S-box-containing protein
MTPQADRPQPFATDSVRRLIALTGGILLAVWVAGILALSGWSQPTSSAVWLSLALGAALFTTGTAWVYFSRRIILARASTIQHEQDRRCRLIVDMAADAILTFTHEGRIESANPAATRLFGYELEEMIGQDISLLINTSGADSVDALLRKELNTGSAKVIGSGTSLMGRHKAGHAMPIELGMSKVIDEDRRLYIQIIRDLTDRTKGDRHRMLQFEVARLLAGDDPLATVGPQILGVIGRYLYWRLGVLWVYDAVSGRLNPAVAWHRGQRAGLVEQRMLATAHTPGVGLVGVVWQRRRWQARAIDGTGPMDDLLTGAALSAGIAWPVELAGQFLGVLEFYTRGPLEVDERLRRCLIPMAMQLAQFIERQRNSEALHKAKDAAEAASRAKSQFLANVSHELRTPLNGVVGLTEILLDTELAPQQREFVGLIQFSAGTLVALITDLLDFSQIEAARMSLQAAGFSLREALGPTLETLTLRAVQRGLTFDWRIDPDVPDRLIGDTLRVQQIFLNLADNAIKFTPEGRVEVRVSVASRTATEVTLHGSIRDTGIGIPADKQTVIFEAFCQADNTRSRRYGGTGLGLTITSRLVAMMGGKIEVSSVPGEGSEFRFAICLAIETHASSPPVALVPLIAAPPLTGKRILVAEDNVVNRVLLELILRKRGHAVEVVSSGGEVLEVVPAGRFDLILMDIQMPGMDGIEATRRLHTLMGDACPPIVAVTAYSMDEDQARCLEAGMKSVLTKPLQQADLLRLIDQMLGAAK